MDYYIDTEFIEGRAPKRFLGFRYGWSKPTIELISIGIVDAKGEEYSALSKGFDLDWAWGKLYKGEYWIRENVLAAIYRETFSGDMRNRYPFNKATMRWVMDNYGKSNKVIAEEVLQFVIGRESHAGHIANTLKKSQVFEYLRAYSSDEDLRPRFYGYYSDYDWVGFCQLFGDMGELPKSFPMYCRDLKQILDQDIEALDLRYMRDIQGVDSEIDRDATFEEKLKASVLLRNPAPHTALGDARWNRKLALFLKKGGMK